MKKLTLLILGVASLGLAACNSGGSSSSGISGPWQYVGNPNFSPQAYSGCGLSPELVFNPKNDQPYVSFIACQAGGGWGGYVMYFDGSTWQNISEPIQIEETRIDLHYSRMGLVFSPAGNQPYVAFSQNIDTEPMTQQPIIMPKVMYFDGVTWQGVGGSSLDRWRWKGYSTDQIVFNPSTNQPYIVVNSRACYAAQCHNSVLKYDGATWDYAGESDVSSQEISSIAFDPATNQPYILSTQAAQSGAGFQIIVKRLENNSWKNVGESISVSGHGIKLIFSPKTNVPYILVSTASDNSMDSMVNVMSFNGSSWQYVGNPRFAATNGDADIAINPATGQPYVAFAGTFGIGKANVMYFDGSTWQYLGDPNFTDATADPLSLAFNPITNLPNLAFVYGNSAKISVISYK
jgi:hypothetical protein